MTGYRKNSGEGIFAGEIKRLFIISILELFAFLFLLFEDIHYLTSRHYYIGNILNDYKSMIIIPVAVFPILISILMFNYLMRSEMAVFMHSLPVTRKELFVKKTFAGILLIVIPTAVFTLILLLLKENSNELSYLLSEEFNVFMNEDILLWMLRTISLQTVLFAIGAFAAQLTGRSFVQLGIAMLIIILPMWFPNALDMNLDFLLRGYRIGSIFQSANGISEFVEAFHLLIYSLSAVIMLFLTYKLYKKRSTESAGNIFVSSNVHVAFILLVTTIGMLISGAVVGSIIGRKSITIYIGCIIGAVIVAIFTNIIYGRYDLGIIPVKKQRYMYAGMLLIITLSLAAAVEFHFNKIPSIDKIESVEIRGEHIIPDLYSNRGIFGINRFSTRENLENITEIHRKIIQDGGNETGSETYRFDYVFKDGRMKTRLYEAPGSKERMEIQKRILLSDEYREKLAMILSYESDSITLYFNDRNEEIHITDELEIRKIKEALLNDYMLMNESDLNHLDNLGNVSFHFPHINNKELLDDPFSFDLIINIYDFCKDYMGVVENYSN